MLVAKGWLERTEKENAWIATEKRHFGSGDYSFEGVDINSMRKEFEAAKERSEALKGKVKASVSGNVAGHRCGAGTLQDALEEGAPEEVAWVGAGGRTGQARGGWTRCGEQRRMCAPWTGRGFSGSVLSTWCRLSGSSLTCTGPCMCVSS